MKESRDRKVVLITGGSSGFGKACVDYLARCGHRVYGTSRGAEFPRNQNLSRLPLIIPMDVCADASVEAAVDFILEREGRLDVLVNNAGFGLAGAIELTSTDEAKRQFETNFFGIHRVCRKVLPAMRSQGCGLIVNISSMAGLIAVPFQGFYCASKYALEALTESLRMEVKPYGVQVTLVEPGDFRTGITANRIRATASHEASVYTVRLSAAIDVITKDEQNGADPRELAVLLGNIMNQKRVRPRYLVGMYFQKMAVWAKRILPASLFEKLIMAYYKIGCTSS
jgi:NAD(P)-dependent dehydrogenase (short-subunit alcohol dehydrogenase family)